MALPSDAKVDFFLCDAARQREDGKLDLQGYFPIPEVRLDVTVPLPVTFDVTFVFVLRDGDGRFHMIFRLLDPLGGELQRLDIPEINKPAGQFHNMMIEVKRIPVNHLGSYSVLLEIDGQPYRRSLTIHQ